jgi:adenine C2-methylase RlmN of 23S rRNA A2503 and tRNA A37
MQVVFMGMGEPADNAHAVRAAVASLCAPAPLGGRGLSRGRVTLSTVAPSPRSFAALLFGDGASGGGAAAANDAAADVGALLAWSLHAADPTLRRALVPTASAAPAELCASLAAALRRRVPKRRRALVSGCLWALV